jgi:hypothetical protein
MQMSKWAKRILHNYMYMFWSEEWNKIDFDFDFAFDFDFDR